jgi:hypothetical protein
MSLSGTIPNSLYELRNLKALHLNDNVPGLHGSIKSEVGNLLQLKEFDLSDNPLLTGTVPSELGLCQNLSTLCKLLSLAMLSILPLIRWVFDFTEEIQLYNTELTGIIPMEICSLRNKKLNIEYAWSSNYFQADCLLNNGTLPPSLDCSCCSTCW